MTGNTCRCRMGTGQYKAGGVVIKAAGRPGGCRVTGSAIVIKVVGNVIGIGCRSEVTGVATITLRGSPGVTTTVTGKTGKRLMRAGQGKLRLIVIEGRRRPGEISMAGEAIVIEVARLVVGVVCLCKVSGMTGET